MKSISIKNNQQIPFDSIPVLEYEQFLDYNTSLLHLDDNHCVNYYGIPYQGNIKLICCIANDKVGLINISSAVVSLPTTLESFSQHHLAFEKFEREIHENFGIQFNNHPWLKPVRFPINQSDKNNTIVNRRRTQGQIHLLTCVQANTSGSDHILECSLL